MSFQSNHPVVFEDDISTLRFGSKLVHLLLIDLSGVYVSYFNTTSFTSATTFPQRWKIGDSLNDLQPMHFISIDLCFSGLEDYDGFRCQLYKDTDLFIVCFDIGNPKTLENVQEVVREALYCNRI